MSVPMIFIPGIKGTKLVETNKVSHDVIFSGLQSNFETIEDLELTGPYPFPEGYRYDRKVDAIIRAGELEGLAYAEFLFDMNDVEHIGPIYIFNYDWRRSCRENGRLLHEFVEYLIKKSEAIGRNFTEFNFVTHSLGNFVLRNYLMRSGFDRVHKIVFVAPPFRGSISMASVVLTGQGWFESVRRKIRKLIKTFPGALELLPSYDKASVFDTAPLAHRFFEFDDWQENVRTDDEHDYPERFKRTLEYARDTVEHHLADLAALPEAQRERILVIARHGYETYQSLKVIRTPDEGPANFFDFENACKTSDGDSAVPHVSSCCWADSVLTLMLDDAWLFREYSHAFVLKDERVQTLVERFFSDTKPFDYRIPGGSVKKVEGVKAVACGKGLKKWETVFA
ncbi:MAG: hypothetical protein HY788_15570 [Deltaproteobacteria bacterium]|nr:hypothetical protein [Deltaproteobacteria bacterium]